MIVLNLLPPIEKKALKIDYFRRAAVFCGILAVFFLALFTVLLIPSYFALKLQIDVLENRIELEKMTAESAKVRELEARVSEINKNLLGASEFSQKSFSLLSLLETLAKIVPAGVRLTGASFSQKTGELVVRGFANTRDGVLAAKYNFETNEKFKEVRSPVSNYLKESDIDFVFFMKIK